MCASRCCSNFYFLNAVCWKSAGVLIWWTGLDGIELCSCKNILVSSLDLFSTMSMIEEMFWSLNVCLFLYYKQNLLIRHSKPAAGWGVIKSIMQELVEIPLCINVAKEMDEVSCSRMTRGKVLQSERYRSSHTWFCPVVSRANVLCTTPHYPPPRQLFDFFSAGNTWNFFICTLDHTPVWKSVLSVSCVSANVIGVMVFCLFERRASCTFLELSSFTDSSKGTSCPQECDLIVKPQPWVWVMVRWCVNKHTQLCVECCSLTLSTGVIKLN